jgi:hypothetical protein
LFTDELVNTAASEPFEPVLYVGELAFRSAPDGAGIEADGRSSERRQELRAKLRAGELEEIVFSAVVYRDGPNGNHTRFRANDLPTFAQSFQGVPFLRNHETGDIGARDGTVVESRMVGPVFAPDGAAIHEFHQTVRLTTERGMKDFLEGMIDRFSIGWYFEGVECSVCGNDWMGCSHWPGQKYDGVLCELIFVKPRGKETSAVNAPAVQGTRIIEQLCQLKAKENFRMAENTILLPDGSVKVVTSADASSVAGATRGATERTGAQLRELPAVEKDGVSADPYRTEVAALRAELLAERVEAAIRNSGLSEEGKGVVRLAAKGRDLEFTAQLIEAQRKVDGARVDASLVRGIVPIVTESMMTTPQERVQDALNWIYGDKQAKTPPPSMRSIRDIYLAVTGDYDWQGRFNPEWAQLASATTTTLAGMTVNALNRVVRLHYDNMLTYRWYEPIVEVSPHDGSTQNVQLLMMDGISALPTVAEGAAYTEATVGDSKEALSFTKKGHYVGITLEAIRRSDIQRIQAVPRLLVQAAIRTRSAAVSFIFTQASGTGPTLADDSTVLFHSNHGNLGTAAFATAEWEAARTRIWEQTVPGTSKPLGLWPTFVLVPIELYDDALTEFGYGQGDVGKPSSAGTAQVVNPYAESRVGDPRPIPIAVPDWTDNNNWAYIVDPRLHPVIHMAYANMPQGGEHPMPEIFEVTSETQGLMFSNDTLPVKIRDWFGVQVSTYVGVGKNNVA